MPSPPGLPICSLPSGEASSSLPGPGGVGPCLVAPGTGFSAGSGRRQLHGSSAYGGNRTPSPPAWLQCLWSPSETCCLSLPPLVCSSLAVFQQVSVLCLCVCAADGRETSARNHEHPSTLRSRCHLSGVPAWRCSAALRVCQPGALVQPCSLLQTCCCPSKSQPV